MTGNAEWTTLETLKQLGVVEAIASLATPKEVQALAIIVRWGGIDGGHHKAWVLDQVTRALAGKEYEDLVAWACDGSDGPETFAWDEGVAP